MSDQESLQEKWDYMIEDSCDGNKSAFARLLKMTPQSFQQYYKGDRKAGWDIIKRILSLGYNLNWFFIGVGPPKLNELKDSNISTIELNNDNTQGYNTQKGEELFNAVDWGDLSNAEADLLEEVKQFSGFLENRQTLRPQVKRLLVQLLIQSIDQAIEQPQHDQDDS